jgi:hypothetical protein
VVAFHADAPARPEDLFLANQIGTLPDVGKIELVIAHPNHWADPGRYMTDLREFGIKLK